MSRGGRFDIESVSTVQVSTAGNMEHSAVAGVDELTADTLDARDFKDIVRRMAADRHHGNFIGWLDVFQIVMKHGIPRKDAGPCGFRADLCASYMPIR